MARHGDHLRPPRNVRRLSRASSGHRMTGNDSNRRPCSPALLLTRRTLLTGAAAGAALGLQPRSAGAVLSIDITQGNIQPIPIAIPDFVGGSSNDGDIARNVTQVIAANLKRS